MASSATAETDTVESEYGSDFSPEEEEIISNLLAAAQSPETEDNPISTVTEYDLPPTLRVPRAVTRQNRVSVPEHTMEIEREHLIQVQSKTLPFDIAYQDLSSQLLISTKQDTITSHFRPNPTSDSSDSPLKLFRTAPKKSLSVTDLVSPSWCELQYHYVLTKHGRKKRTPAMKAGSLVHKALEDTLYQTVPIDIQTREDQFGLHIWNVIQGLRTLRDQGQTRELEVWGIVDREVVIGIIDEISFVCPDEDLEASVTKMSLDNQQTIEEAFEGRPKRSLRKIYITDVKTRFYPSIPNETSFRPTRMQLMLYHHLLGALATDKVPLSVIAARHKLNLTTPFSDSFIAQVGSLNEELGDSQTGGVSQDAATYSQDSLTTLLHHNSLSLLWALMIREFAAALPHGRDSISDVLTAEYRTRPAQAPASNPDDSQSEPSITRQPGRADIIGTKSFLMDSEVLERYLDHGMGWWKGERAPEGVVEEEAWKCRSCEFVDGCEWRIERGGVGWRRGKGIEEVR